MLKHRQNTVIVAIPYYHTDLSEKEIISLGQAQKVLEKYDLCLIAPLRLQSLLKTQKYQVEYFEDSFFENVSTYNRLMLTTEFYERFKLYRYMLVYQLDAFVFYDRLSYFCDLNYDYIGAPWIYPEKGMIGDIPQKAYVGNGGLSLRNVRSCIKALRDKRMELGELNCNEDFFFSASKAGFKVAPLSVAIEFSFETHVRKCFEINGRRLPFGCHAWERYDFSFWKPYIEKFGYDLSGMELISCYEDSVLDKKLEDYKYKLLEVIRILPLNMQKLLRKNGLNHRRFTIWGAGKYGKQIVEIFLQFGLEVDYVIDENELLENRTIYKVPIMNFQTYKSLNLNNVIIVAVKKYIDDIQKRLEENNFVRKKDYISILDLSDLFYIEVLYNICMNDEGK